MSKLSNINMKSIDIDLRLIVHNGTDTLTYKHGINMDVIRKIDHPQGYMYYNIKPRLIGPYTINRIIDKSGSNFEFGGLGPFENVINFFVYYPFSCDRPLMMCIATLQDGHFLRFRYFHPENKDSLNLKEIYELTVDPKTIHNFHQIRKKLDHLFTLMGGVDIDIYKTYEYSHKNTLIKATHLGLIDYNVFSHEIEGHYEFTVTRIRCGDKILNIEIKRPVIAVHAITHRIIGNYRPIILCIVEKSKTKHKGNNYRWYALKSLTSNEWEHKQDCEDLCNYDELSSMFDKFTEPLYHANILIDKDFFFGKHKDEFFEEDLLLNAIELGSHHDQFSLHGYETSGRRKIKIKSVKIYGKEQTGLPREMYGGFYLFCHKIRDPHMPVIISVRAAENEYKWYQLEHYASNHWIECSLMSHMSVEEGDYHDRLEEIYDNLFWVNMDIGYDNIRRLKNYNRNTRNIDIIENQRYGFKMIEIIDKGSCPLNVRIFREGITQEGIGDLQQIQRVNIFYYDKGSKNEPIFIAFVEKNSYNIYSWYGRTGEDSDYWTQVEELERVDPNSLDWKVLKTVNDGIYLYQEYEKEEAEANRTVAAKAVGSTVGAAAFCGVGYLVYSNAGTILHLIR